MGLEYLAVGLEYLAVGLEYLGVGLEYLGEGVGALGRGGFSYRGVPTNILPLVSLPGTECGLACQRERSYKGEQWRKWDISFE